MRHAESAGQPASEDGVSWSSSATAIPNGLLSGRATPYDYGAVAWETRFKSGRDTNGQKEATQGAWFKCRR